MNYSEKERKTKEKIGQILIDSREVNDEFVIRIGEVFWFDEKKNSEIRQIIDHYNLCCDNIEEDINLAEQYKEFEPEEEDFPYIWFPILNNIYTEILYAYVAPKSETED